MREATSIRAPAAKRALLEPPGGILMWIVVALELVTFAIILVMLAGFRSSEPSVFSAGQRLLDPRFGLGLTLTLLTSGWLVAEAVHAVRLERLVRARWLYGAGIGVGLVFVGLKASDYLAKRALGLGLNDDFGAAYMLATGFHLAHVLVGLVMLVYVATRVGRKPFEHEETAVAGTALFWHMCDIAWLFLFPVFYVS
jgi:nitric oxide reductase NorE protein